MGSRDHSGEMQLAAIGVREVSTILRDLQCEFIRTTALLLFCSSNQTGAHEQLDHVVTSCHGTFAGVDLRHEAAQRISKGSRSSTGDPFFALLDATVWVVRSHHLMTSNGHPGSSYRGRTW